MAKSLREKGRGKTFDQMHLGNEPDYSRGMPDDRKTELIYALQWYNYFTSGKDHLKDLITYVKDKRLIDEFSKDIQKKYISAIKNFNPNANHETALKMARMVQRGWVMDHNEELLVNGLVFNIFKDVADKEETKTESKVIRISPAVRLKLKTNETVLAELEEMVDQWNTVKIPVPLNVYELIDKHDLKGPVPVNAIKDWLVNLKKEYELAQTDKEYAEAYSYLKKVDLKRRIKAIETMIADTEAKKTATVSNRRTTRKKKDVTLDKLLAKFNYKKEDKDLKLVSIDPAKFIGHKHLFVLNPRNNELHYYVAEGPNGLTVKGSAIINFDSSKSFKKRIKKELFEVILKKTPRQIATELKKVQSKQTDVSGRVSKEMLLIRSAK